MLHVNKLSFLTALSKTNLLIFGKAKSLSDLKMPKNHHQILFFFQLTFLVITASSKKIRYLFEKASISHSTKSILTQFNLHVCGVPIFK